MGVPVNTALQVSLEYTANLQKCLNVLHWRCQTVSSAATLDTEYDELLDALGAGVGGANLFGRFRDCMSNTAVLNAVRLQFVWPIRRRFKRYSVVGGAGTRAGNCQAQNLQGSIVKVGDLANRKGRGAMRVGGLSASDIVGGSLSAALIDELVDLGIAVKAILTTFGGGVWWPIIWGNPGPNANSAGADFFNTFVQPEVRTQRTRTVGRGK